MSIEIDSIIHADMSFLDYRNQLYSLYLDSYGEEYSSLIRDRMRNTLYLFDSNPIDTMNFFINHQNSISDDKLFSFYEKEYQDYLLWKKKLDSRYQKKYYQLLSYSFHYKSRDWDDLFRLDYSSFNLKNQSILNSSQYSEQCKREILERQKKYLEDCSVLGIVPLTDYVSIHLIENKKNYLESQRNIALLQRTKWGKRMIRKIRDYCRLPISDIQSILNRDSVATTNFIFDNNGLVSSSILHFPVIQNIPHGCLDRMLFHENRHVIESGKNHCGIYYYPFLNISLMNELHTEDNAIVDSKKCFDNPLWSSDDMDSESYNLYELLLMYTDGFFDRKRDLLNQCAICGNYDLLKDYFSSDDLLELEHFLEDVKNSFVNHHSFHENDTLARGKQIIKKME